jgi:hypothetical protein
MAAQSAEKLKRGAGRRASGGRPAGRLVFSGATHGNSAARLVDDGRGGQRQARSSPLRSLPARCKGLKVDDASHVPRTGLHQAIESLSAAIKRRLFLASLFKRDAKRPAVRSPWALDGWHDACIYAAIEAPGQTLLKTKWCGNGATATAATTSESFAVAHRGIAGVAKKIRHGCGQTQSHHWPA